MPFGMGPAGWAYVSPRTLILTLASLIQCGRGGVVGEVAGVAAEVVGAAGAGLRRTGIPTGRTIT